MHSVSSDFFLLAPWPTCILLLRALNLRRKLGCDPLLQIRSIGFARSRREEADSQSHLSAMVAIDIQYKDRTLLQYKEGFKRNRI